MSQLLSIFNHLSEDNIADYYQALYWYCSHNHAGQNDLLYTILSLLQYKPSLTECSYNGEITIESDYHARCIYMALQLWASVQEHLEGWFCIHIHPLSARTDIYCVEFSRGVDKAYRVYHIDCEYLIIQDLTQQDV